MFIALAHSDSTKGSCNRRLLLIHTVRNREQPALEVAVRRQPKPPPLNSVFCSNLDSLCSKAECFYTTLCFEMSSLMTPLPPPPPPPPQRLDADTRRDWLAKPSRASCRKNTSYQRFYRATALNLSPNPVLPHHDATDKTVTSPSNFVGDNVLSGFMTLGASGELVRYWYGKE